MTEIFVCCLLKVQILIQMFTAQKFHKKYKKIIKERGTQDDGEDRGNERKDT